MPPLCDLLRRAPAGRDISPGQELFNIARQDAGMNFRPAESAAMTLPPALGNPVVTALA
jgi:hypothetical protein